MKSAGEAPAQKGVGVTVALIVAALTIIIIVDGLVGSLLVVHTGAPNTRTSMRSTGSITRTQYVYENKIFDENEREVIWRGAGGSYLFHTDDYILAWEKHIPEIQKMGLNTIRLAFRFPDSSPGEDGYVASDTLDYAKLDDVLDLLDRYNIKAILDLHNYFDMYGDFGSQKLIDNWVELAKRYRGDPRIVAYELFNEPGQKTWHSSIETKEDVIHAYANLTKEIRKVDSKHIHIWQAHQAYVPPLDEMADYLQPNVVYTIHRYYKKYMKYDFWTPQELSYMTLDYLVEMRKKINAPFWLGEFGSSKPFDSSNPEWLITEQLLLRCEEQVIGWNLWMSRTDIDKPWDAYLPFFPLKTYNINLIRKPWNITVPKLMDYVIDYKGLDRLEPYVIEMWHDDDYVIFNSGIVILVITNHRLQDGSFEVVSKEEISITEQLKIQNEERTTEHLGDWNIIIYGPRILAFS